MSEYAQVMDRVDAMNPVDAVDYLLGMIGDLMPAVLGEGHETDNWNVPVNPSERLILAALWEYIFARPMAPFLYPCPLGVLNAGFPLCLEFQRLAATSAGTVPTLNKAFSLCSQVKSPVSGL